MIQYVIKSEPDLTHDCVITKNVIVKGGVLTIKHEGDIVSLSTNGWLINDFPQGEGASFPYSITSDEVIDSSHLLDVFELKVENATN